MVQITMYKTTLFVISEVSKVLHTHMNRMYTMASFFILFELGQCLIQSNS